MDFSTRLKKLRKLNNYTQEDLAKLLGITAGAVGLYEQNRREPDNNTVKQLARIFNVTIDYLLGFDDNFSSEPTIVSSYNGGDSELTFDDFTYAMHNESQTLTEDQKQILLNMAKALNNSNKE